MALLLCCVGLAQAQTRDDGNAGDPPDRVARLAYLQGDLGLLPAGAQDWGDADINRPLTRGDRLSSAADARAELQFDGARLRLAGATDAGLLELNDQLAQIELTRGTVNLAVRRLADGQSYEIDTPTVALVLDRPGTFRIDIDRDGQTTIVTAFEGDATVYGANGAQRDVHAGRSYRFADATLDAVMISDIDRGDAFDAWCSERDRRYASAGAPRYVSDEVIGYQDLDAYGDWRNDPDYGAVWYPSDVASDWAPYRFGRWVWVAPWGWTWVDDSPWGFAPYHYGRWAYARGGWCWVPGPPALRPVYAPALVAFIGGGGWSLSLGIGDTPIGWFPLGPGEVYDPWYRTSRRYYQRVNVANIHVRDSRRRALLAERIDHRYDGYRRGLPTRGDAYVNRRAPHGVTAVPAHSFVSAGRVQRDRLRIDPSRLARAPILRHDRLLAPTPHSFAPGQATHVRARPTGSFDRAVVTHRPPAGFAGPRATAQPGYSATRPAERQAAARPRLQPPQGERPSAGRLPAVPVIRPARPIIRGDQRVGELPSARFTRSLRDESPSRAKQRVRREQASDASRPGVSYIPSARQDRQRQPVASGATLPAVPRIRQTPPLPIDQARRAEPMPQRPAASRDEPGRSVRMERRPPPSAEVFRQPRERPPMRIERQPTMPARSDVPAPRRPAPPVRAAPARPAQPARGNHRPPPRGDEQRN
jgi:hypothetical protein